MEMVCTVPRPPPETPSCTHTRSHGKTAGEISAAELGSVMRSLGLKPTDKELEDMVNEVDTDHTGTIDINGAETCPAHTHIHARATLIPPAEFLVMMSHAASPQDTEDELRQAFRVFDRDNSGTINPSELRDVLKTLGEDLTDQEIGEIMNAADTDGDKSIDCERLAGCE